MSIFDRFSPEEYDAFHEDRSQSSPETQADTQILYDALQRLPHKQREAFVLFEISGFSLQEIQEMQGDSLSAVKMRLVRARETLRTMLQDRFAQGSETAPVHKASIHHLSNPSSSEQNAIRQANISPLRRST
jgi:DNA-directed RNA polymerase specialized sigma24 family protein